MRNIRNTEPGFAMSLYNNCCYSATAAASAFAAVVLMRCWWLYGYVVVGCGPNCRESETLSPVAGDPWASREFYIKWKRYSYIHCSWDSRAVLDSLRGYKRVVIYIKKVRIGVLRSFNGIVFATQLFLYGRQKRGRAALDLLVPFMGS